MNTANELLICYYICAKSSNLANVNGFDQSKHRRMCTTSALSPHTLPYTNTHTHPHSHPHRHPQTTQEMSVELLWAVRGQLSWCNPTLHFALHLLLQPVFASPDYVYPIHLTRYSEVRNVLKCVVCIYRLHRTSTVGP